MHNPFLKRIPALMPGQVPTFGHMPESMQRLLADFEETKTLAPTDPVTLDDLRKVLRDENSDRMWMNPVAPNDLRHRKPYFLVPLLEVAEPGEHEVLREEIIHAATELRVANRPVTDLFVVSHGWHRNLFSGVAAYDRLISRFLMLLGRGRLFPNRQRLPDPSKFSPLFICLHWHSDPGEDAWVDGAGRRDKTSFLQIAASVFESKPAQDLPGGPPPNFQNDFEDLFAIMSEISAPDVPTNMGSDSSAGVPASPTATDFTTRVTESTAKLTSCYQHKGLAISSVARDPANLICSLWRCYDEADAHQVLVDQALGARPVGSPATAIGSLIGFVVGAAGVASLIPAVLKFADSLVTEDLKGSVAVHWPFILIALYAISILLMNAAIAWKTISKRASDKKDVHPVGKSKPPNGMSPAVGLVWIVAQVTSTLPALVVLFITCIFRSTWALFSLPLFYMASVHTFGVAWQWWSAGGAAILLLAAVVATEKSKAGDTVSGLFNERLQKAGDEPFNYRDYLAAAARWPIFMLREIVGRDSSLLKIAQLFDNQLGFFELQRKGVDAGDDAGRFLRILMAQDNEKSLGGAKIHFVGHSFGGLVILNAARRLFSAFDSDGRFMQTADARAVKSSKKNTEIREVKRRYDSPEGDAPSLSQKASMALLQSATASDWFRPEQKLLNAFNTIGCVYSKYDTANGFYYPCANNGRMAAGYVGLCKVPDVQDVPVMGHGGEFTMLVEPPTLLPVDPGKPALNLDASRLIFNGAVASGGGHDDIFKDDVVNLIWAITQR